MKRTAAAGFASRASSLDDDKNELVSNDMVMVEI
jgi:hypothetical protein